MKKKYFLLFAILIMALLIGQPAEAKTKVASTKINKIKTDGTEVTISLKKVKNSSGYQIYRSTKKNKGFKKIATLKGKNNISYTDKKVKENTQYFYKIKCYVQKGKKKTYSAFCAVKSIKTKEKDKEEEQKEVKVTGIKIYPESADIKVGKTYNALSITIVPSNATNKNVTWSSSNTNIISINKDGTFTTKAEGTCDIIAKTVDGGFTAKCTFTCYTNHEEDAADFVPTGQCFIRWDTPKDASSWVCSVWRAYVPDGKYTELPSGDTEMSTREYIDRNCIYGKTYYYKIVYIDKSYKLKEVYLGAFTANQTLQPHMVFYQDLAKECLGYVNAYRDQIGVDRYNEPISGNLVWNETLEKAAMIRAYENACQYYEDGIAKPEHGRRGPNKGRHYRWIYYTTEDVGYNYFFVNAEEIHSMWSPDHLRDLCDSNKVQMGAAVYSDGKNYEIVFVFSVRDDENAYNNPLNSANFGNVQNWYDYIIKPTRIWDGMEEADGMDTVLKQYKDAIRISNKKLSSDDNVTTMSYDEYFSSKRK